MDKTYKISSDKIGAMAIRDIRKSAIIILATTIFFVLIMTFMFKYGKGVSHAENVLPIFIGSGIFTLLISALILWNTYSFKKLFYGNYKISITEEEVKKFIDIDNNPELSGLNKMNWEKVKRLTPQYNIAVKWNDIKRVIENNYGLYVKTSSASNFYGSGQLIIPNEMEGYEEIKRIVNDRGK